MQPTQLMPQKVRQSLLQGLALLTMLLVSTPSTAVTAIGTETLLNNFFGVNLHLDNCCQGNYADRAKVIAEINYIGARRLRDWPGTQANLLDKWKEVFAGTQAPFHASIPVGSPAYQRIGLGIIKDWLQYAPRMIDVIEGGNEEDMDYAVQRGATLADTALLQYDVYKVGQNAGVKVAQMSVGANWYPPLYEGNYKAFGQPPADLGNAHVYMTPTQPPSIVLSRIGDLAAWSVPGKPVDVTEFGVYRSSLQNDAAVSAYMHIAPFTSYLLGHAGLSVYALHDDMTGVVSFYDASGNKRPFADYWHNTTQLLADPNGKALTTKEIDIRYTNAVAKGYGVKHVPMYKSDGSIWVAVYNEQKTNGTASSDTISFGRTYATLSLIDGRSGVPERKEHNVQSITLSLPANHLYFVVASDVP